jgi:hypothetical protein
MMDIRPAMQAVGRPSAPAAAHAVGGQRLAGLEVPRESTAKLLKSLECRVESGHVPLFYRVLSPTRGQIFTVAAVVDHSGQVSEQRPIVESSVSLVEILKLTFVVLVRQSLQLVGRVTICRASQRR